MAEALLNVAVVVQPEELTRLLLDKIRNVLPGATKAVTTSFGGILFI
jgi:hypothetical protein